MGYKEYKKIVLLIVSAILSICIVVYLGSAYINASFDIREWSKAYRVLSTFITLCLDVLVLFLLMDHLSNERDRNNAR